MNGVLLTYAFSNCACYCFPGLFRSTSGCSGHRRLGCFQRKNQTIPCPLSSSLWLVGLCSCHDPLHSEHVTHQQRTLKEVQILRNSSFLAWYFFYRFFLSEKCLIFFFKTFLKFLTKIVLSSKILKKNLVALLK